MLAFTNCKINIGLDVVATRPDGYHDIVTCMVPVPWHDIVEIVPAKGHDTTLTVLGNKVDCPTEKNLVMKAYRALERRYDLPPVDIVLRKIVPDGAGLGGGSADATYTLRLLNDMFSLGIPEAQMLRIAASIGADCAFFVYDRPMMCEGIGDILSPAKIDLRGFSILIAKDASVNISTKDAYAGIDVRQPETPLGKLLEFPVDMWQGFIKNDFEKSIFKAEPRIARLKQMMIDSGAVYASMSGSGASVYGIFDDDDLAQACRKKVEHLPSFLFKVR